MSLGLPHYLTCRQGILPFKWRYDAALTERGYLKNLGKELSESSRPLQIDSRLNLIRIRASQIFHEEGEHMFDQMAQFYLLISAYILASYLVLNTTGMAEAEIKNIISNSLYNTGNYWHRWLKRIRNLWHKIRDNPHDDASRRENAAAEYMQRFLTRHTDHCVFRAFFQRHQHTQLSGLICNCNEKPDQ